MGSTELISRRAFIFCLKEITWGQSASYSTIKTKEDWEIPCHDGYKYRSGRGYYLSFPHLTEGKTEYEDMLKEIRRMIDQNTAGQDLRDVFLWENIAKSFHRISFTPQRNSIASEYDIENIKKCYYKGEVYFLGIGLPQPVVTNDMLEKAEWFVYTWDD